MKQLVFLATMMMATTLGFAQSESEKISSLIELVSKDGAKKDSILSEIEKIRDNTTSKNVKAYSTQAISVIKEIINLEKNIVFSQPLSILSKDDLKNFKINEDKFRNITFIHHNRERDFYPYLSIKEGRLNMRLKAKYIGRGWIFFEEVIILAGNKRYTISFPNNKRDVRMGGEVYEAGDIWVSPEIFQELREIILNDTVEIRYSGQKIHDRKLSKQEIVTLKEVIALYDKLKEEN